MVARLIDHSIGKAPADARGIGTEHRIDIGGYLGLHRLEIFQNPASGPVDVRALVEDDVDEGTPEEGKSPDNLDFRRRQQGGGDGISDLVFHQVGAASRPFRIDDHLGVAQIGNGIEGGFQQCPVPPDDKECN